MKKIYLATHGGKAEKAFSTKKEALNECAKMAKDYYEKITAPMESVSDIYKIKVTEDGYNVLFSYFYVIPVELLKGKSE